MSFKDDKTNNISIPKLRRQLTLPVPNECYSMDEHRNVRGTFDLNHRSNNDLIPTNDISRFNTMNVDHIAALIRSGVFSTRSNSSCRDEFNQKNPFHRDRDEDDYNPALQSLSV